MLELGVCKCGKCSPPFREGVGSLEADLGSLVVSGALLLGYFKHRLGVESEHIGEDVGRECLHGIVELLGGGVEEAACGGQ